MSGYMECVSVIVPIYNAELYLRRCLDSILAQSYSHLEIILVDDGSVDSSGNICNLYGENNSNIEVIHIKHSGVTCARLKGCEIASGKYISFVDADDWIEQDYIENMVLEIGEGDILLCGICKGKNGIKYMESCEKNRFPAGKYYSQKEKEIIYSKMLYYEPPFIFGVLPYMCNKLFKREFIYSFLLKLDQRICDGEDVAVIYPYLLAAQKIIVSDRCKYHYCIYSNSASFQKKKDGYLNATYLYQSLYQDFCNSDYAEVLMPQLEQYMRFLIWKENAVDYLKVNSFYFPYREVNLGADIILYGAGMMGQTLYYENSLSNYCNVVAWADKKYENIEKCTGEMCQEDNVPKIAPCEIDLYMYDYIVIAIQDKMIVDEVIKAMKKQKINEKKMIVL